VIEPESVDLSLRMEKARERVRSVGRSLFGEGK
jgi:hypothetical protein